MTDYILDVLNQASKLDWAFPFQRTGPFPLDRSSVFSSYADAELYAQGKNDSRGLSGSSYVGQTISVYDSQKNAVTLYLIQPDRTLSIISSPDETDISSILNNIEDIRENLTDIYSKEETEKVVATALSSANHLSRKIVDNKEAIDVFSENASSYIYMVPTGLQYDDDKYDEYIVINNTLEKVGSWEVNLDNYATKTEIILNSVSNDFTINNKQLTLNNLSISKIEGLEDILNNKIDAIEGYTLLSPEDKAKLDKLVIDEDDNLEISGSVNADNIIGLETWLNEKANSVKGLSENNLNDDLYEKLSNLLFIVEVEKTEFKVDNGKLDILEIDQSKITGLTDALNAKASKESIEETKTLVQEIADSLAYYATLEQHNADIQELRDILIWKEM